VGVIRLLRLGIVQGLDQLLDGSGGLVERGRINDDGSNLGGR
jgi:hypothetical protein